MTEVAGPHVIATAPLQGTVVLVAVAVGDVVAAGQTLAVLESMKMEHVVVADAGGTVREVGPSAGDTVEKGDRLCMTFKISRDRHGELLAQVAKHGMTVTDILTLHIDQIIPVLEKAKPVDVPGYKKDKRLRISQVLKRQKDTEKAKWSV